MKKAHTFAIGTAISLVLSANAPIASAQEAVSAEASVESNDTNTIIVMARKRAESVQDVPLSITAVNAAALDRNFITQIDQVTKLTPNVLIQPVSISPTQAAPFIRGIGARSQEPSQDPPIAISIDGVYLSQTSGSLLDVFDAEQVEVLRGPQGTLQGRNSPGGALNVTTRRPGNELAARFEGSYGNYNEYQLKGAVEAPVVTDILAVKAAAFYTNRDGYSQNYTTGERMGNIDSFAARVGVLFTPTPDIDWYVTGDYTRDRSGQPALRYVGSDQPRRNLAVPATCTSFNLCTPDERRTTGMNFVDGNAVDIYGLTSNFDWRFGDVALTSVTGYRRNDDKQNVDVDGTLETVLNSVKRDLQVKQFSQELRLASDSAGRRTAGTFDWVVGLYYLNSKFDLYEAIAAFGGDPSPANRNQTLNSYAVFGQGIYQITDAWSISVGARQSWDKKRLYTQPAGDVGGTFRGSFDNLSLEAGTEYKLNEDTLAYFRFSQGYRSGGINGNASVLAAVAAYDPEIVDAFEVGIKSEMMNGQLLANISAFSYDYQNLQRDVVVTLPVAPFFAQQVQNIGKAKIQGIEAELTARPSDNFTVNMSFGYLDAKNKTAAYRDLRIPYTPKVTVAAGFDWTIPMGDNSFNLGADVNLKSKYSVNPDDIEISDQSAIILVDSFAAYHFNDDRYSIGLYGRNLFNSYYITAAEPTGGITYWTVEGAPRTYGVRFQAKF